MDPTEEHDAQLNRLSNTVVEKAAVAADPLIFANLPVAKDGDWGSGGKQICTIPRKLAGTRITSKNGNIVATEYAVLTVNRRGELTIFRVGRENGKIVFDKDSWDEFRARPDSTDALGKINQALNTSLATAGERIRKTQGPEGLAEKARRGVTQARQTGAAAAKEWGLDREYATAVARAVADPFASRMREAVVQRTSAQNATSLRKAANTTRQAVGIATWIASDIVRLGANIAAAPVKRTAQAYNWVTRTRDAAHTTGLTPSFILQIRAAIDEATDNFKAVRSTRQNRDETKETPAPEDRVDPQERPATPRSTSAGKERWEEIARRAQSLAAEMAMPAFEHLPNSDAGETEADRLKLLSPVAKSSFLEKSGFVPEGKTTKNAFFAVNTAGKIVLCARVSDSSSMKRMRDGDQVQTWELNQYIAEAAGEEECAALAIEIGRAREALGATLSGRAERNRTRTSSGVLASSLKLLDQARTAFQHRAKKQVDGRHAPAARTI